MTYQFKCVNGACEYMGEVVDKQFKMSEVSDAKPKCTDCSSILHRHYGSVGIGTSDNFKRSV